MHPYAPLFPRRIALTSPSPCFYAPFGRCSRSLFSIFAVSFQSYCSLLCPARSYLYTPTHDYLVYRAYANARAYPRNGVGASARYYVSRGAKPLSRKRKKFIRPIKNALRDFIRVRKLPAWISKNYITNRSAAVSIGFIIFTSASYSALCTVAQCT